jgi:radical SAM superfamily enzyme YgiQ (UPF0313 family)
MAIDYYKLARESFESSILPDKTVKPEVEKNNFYAGLVAFTFAVENHLNEILKAVQERKG